MSSKLKIAIIGAGSPLFTVNLMNSLLSKKELYGSKILLTDIDLERLNFMYRYCKKLMAENDTAYDVFAMNKLDEAIAEVDFVIVAAAIGGMRMRKYDVEVPLKYGITHIKGDTTGPAGIFMGLRSIPFMVDLGKRMEKLCPKAVIINLTNPLTVITRAVSKATDIKTVGICATIDAMKYDMAGKLGVDHQRLELYSIGVNHFTWLLGIYLDGKNITRAFLKNTSSDYEKLPITGDLHRTYGSFPIPGFKYASEFFPYYLRLETNMGGDYGFEPANSIQRAKNADAIYGTFKQRLETGDSLTEKPDNIDTNTIAGFIESTALNKSSVINLNMPNCGRIGVLPYDAVIEGPVFVSGECTWPLCSYESLPERVVKLLERVVYEQELVVEAGLKGDKELVMEAFLMDPMVKSPDDARKIINELMELEKDYLPQFHLS